MLSLVSPKGWGKIEEEIENENYCWLRAEQHSLCWDLSLQPFRPWKEKEVYFLTGQTYFSDNIGVFREQWPPLGRRK